MYDDSARFPLRMISTDSAPSHTNSSGRESSTLDQLNFSLDSDVCRGYTSSLRRRTLCQSGFSYWCVGLVFPNGSNTLNSRLSESVSKCGSMM